MNKSARLVLLSIVFAVAGSLSAADESAFANANKAYSEARFQEAADGYESLVRSGNWNANLFYDLGNAYYRLGNFGKSILNFERALALDPRHPEAEANLRLARDEARALELRQSWIERYASLGTVKQYSVAASLAFWAVLFLTAYMWVSRRLSSGRIALVALSSMICGVSIYAMFALENGTRGKALAVVTAKEIEARFATADNARSVLLLPAGSEIKILSERGEWVYAALPNEQRGWIPASSAERVRM